MDVMKPSPVKRRPAYTHIYTYTRTHVRTHTRQGSDLGKLHPEDLQGPSPESYQGLRGMRQDFQEPVCLRSVNLPQGLTAALGPQLGRYFGDQWQSLLHGAESL